MGEESFGGVVGAFSGRVEAVEGWLAVAREGPRTSGESAVASVDEVESALETSPRSEEELEASSLLRREVVLVGRRVACLWRVMVMWCWV